MTRKVDPEEFLKQFTFRAAPPRLKGKVFPAPAEKTAPGVIWTSLQRKALAAFLVLGISAVLVDAGLARFQKDRLSGFLHPPVVSARDNRGQDELLAEVWSGDADSTWIEARLKLEKKAGRIEVRRETSLYLKEEFDGS